MSMGVGICSRIRQYYSDTVLAYRGAPSDDISSMFTHLYCLHMYFYNNDHVLLAVFSSYGCVQEYLSLW